MQSILKRSAGISLDTFLALMISSQNDCAETASPGNFMFMPMMAMGIVLSPPMIAVCYGISIWAQGIPGLRRPVLVLWKMDASTFQEESVGKFVQNNGRCSGNLGISHLIHIFCTMIFTELCSICSISRRESKYVAITESLILANYGVQQGYYAVR